MSEESRKIQRFIDQAKAESSDWNRRGFNISFGSLEKALDERFADGAEEKGA